MSTSTHTCLQNHPSSNLPSLSSTESRKEDRMIELFINKYAHEVSRKCLLSQQMCYLVKELPVNGYGIADLVHLKSKYNLEMLGDEHSFDIKVASELDIRSFEFKLTDWRRGLSQACRYNMFSNTSILVVPKNRLRTPVSYIEIFKDLKVGLWGFDEERGTITKIYTPRSRAIKMHKYLSQVVSRVSSTLAQHIS